MGWVKYPNYYQIDNILICIKLQILVNKNPLKTVKRTKTQELNV